jgi:hypothetical protein
MMPHLPMDKAYERNKLILITVLITMFVTSAAWVGIGAVGYWALYNEPPRFDVAVDCPPEVVLGEVLKAKVSVKNDGGKNLKLENLDVYRELLDGFEILSVNPKPRTTERIVDYISYGFSRSLKPGETFDFEIEMRAKEIGVWGGDIDACTTMQTFITHYTEIEVVDAAPTPAE